MTRLAPNVLALAAGGVDDTVLLDATWLECGQRRWFGHEAIMAALRRSPMPDAASPTSAASPNAAAIIVGDQGLFADVIDGRTTALWRIGAPSQSGPSAVAVAFDADLAQDAEKIWFAQSDHPMLDAESATRLLSRAAKIVSDAEDGVCARCRVVVRRAFAIDGRIGALLGVYRWPAASPCAPCFSNMVTVITADAIAVAADRFDFGQAADQWRPRL